MLISENQDAAVDRGWMLAMLSQEQNKGNRNYIFLADFRNYLGCVVDSRCCIVSEK